MYRKVIKFTDYDGNEREGTFYFNLTKAEIIKWEGAVTGTLHEKIQRMQQTDDRDELIKLFDDIIGRAYGEKSLDGMYFRKSPEILENFKATEAYTNLFMELASNDEAGAEFVNGILPADLLEALEESRREQSEEGKKE